jgi:flagellar biosynthesis/type III secretory pathway protein FliH
MKKTNDALRTQYLNLITELLAGADEEVLRVKSNEIAIPCVDDEGNDSYVVVTIKVPTGSRDGDPYDGYGEAESYAIACKQKAEKAAAEAEKKAKKIARDQAYRAKQAENKAKREGD